MAERVIDGRPEKGTESRDVKYMSTLTDRFGNTFSFGNAGDFWFPPFRVEDGDHRKQARNIRDMTIRDDDILICSYPKTGLHWHSEIVNMLRNQDAAYVSGKQNNSALLDMRPVSDVDKLTSPRVLYMHVPFRYIPKQALEKKVKILYLDRNPKDVLVSYYNLKHEMTFPFDYLGTFEQFVCLNLEVGPLYGDLFDYLMEWQKGIEDNPDAQIYTSVFEDMKLDPVNGVIKLNDFLGTGCSKELCQEIAEACTFKKMKTVKDKNNERFERIFKSNAQGMYRKGEVGDWKNWFTVALNERFDAEYARRMSGYKRVYKYTL